MSLSPGTRLGPYEVVAPIGVGGMGEVYRARDGKLHREVAIKVLPEAFARDAERLARFRREAQVLASLNHPHIASIYGLEESGGVEALVLELVEGETLAERIARDTIPVDEASKIACQIAEALAAAHEKGIIHRDLKPANVKLTADGEVKVLDFGLAKLLIDEPRPIDATHSPTITAATQAGVVLGTAAYMSPEQARGKTVDKRADIWAFGAVLFETLTGKKAFAGETVSDTLAAILTKEPDWAALPAGTPRSIRRVVRRCLNRDRNLRFHDIADARIELQEPSEPPAVAASRPGVPWWVLAAAVLVAAGLAALALRGTGPPTELPLRKLEIAAPFLDVDGANPISLSPDGTRIAYSADGRLWIRDLRQLEAREVPGSSGAGAPFWSPDGSFVGFASEKKLWKMSSGGGDRTAVAELSGEVNRASGVAWDSASRIVFSLGFTGLLQAPADGGKSTPLLEPDPKTDADFHTPGTLPGGRGVLFVVHRAPQGPDTIAALAGGARKTLLQLPGEHLWHPTYSPSGHLLFRRDAPYRGVWAVAFSLSRLEAVGSPFLVAQNAKFPAAASNGALAFSRGPFETLTRLVWKDRNGREVGTVGEPGFFTPLPALSPDGRRLAIAISEEERTEIWILDLERGTRRRLTAEGVSPGAAPVWSPSGDRIAYQTGGDQDSLAIWMRPADAGGEARLIARGMGGCFTPDGKAFVYSTLAGMGTEFNLAYVRFGADTEPVVLARAPGTQAEPAVSPDGRYVAYSSWLAGRSEVEIRPFPSGEGKWQVSSDGGRSPKWGRNGDELFYARDNDIMAVEVKTSPTLSLGPPRKLFTREQSGAKVEWFGILMDGFETGEDAGRFLMLKNAGSGDPGRGRTIAIVQNWFAEFRGKDPK
ncbi:MAG: protein kinase [Acidobacteria bacterium]|nr:protein kinase [Acidobacteriota bacterium]